MLQKRGFEKPETYSFIKNNFSNPRDIARSFHVGDLFAMHDLPPPGHLLNACPCPTLGGGGRARGQHFGFVVHRTPRGARVLPAPPQENVLTGTEGAENFFLCFSLVWGLPPPPRAWAKIDFPPFHGGGGGVSAHLPHIFFRPPTFSGPYSRPPPPPPPGQ